MANWIKLMEMLMQWQATDRLAWRVGLLLGVGLVSIVVWLSLSSSPPQGPQFQSADKVGHFLAYFFVSSWFGQLFYTRLSQWWVVISLVILGVLLEWLQGALGFRHAEWRDAVANTMGVLAGWLICRTMARFTWLRLSRVVFRRR